MSPYKDSCRSEALVVLIVAGLLLTGLSSLVCGRGDARADPGLADYAPWWDYSWIFRKPLTLDNSQNPKALTDYPLLINLSGNDLIASGKMRPDWGDLRFTDADGTTPLKYWVETEGNVWVKVPSIPASARKTIYFYYGNQGAALTSDGSKVFDVFDQFEGNSLDTGKWTLMNRGAYTVANGVFTISADGRTQPGKAIATTAPMEDNYVLRSRFKITGGLHTDERIGLSIKCGTGDGRGYNYVFRDFTNLNYISFLDDYVVWNSRAGNWQKNTYYVEEIYHDGTNVQGRLNDGQWQTQAWKGRSGYPALYFGSYDGTSVWDWALVRKFQPPDPKVTLGPEENPFKFLAATCSNESPNERDLVTLNVTFNNPTSNPVFLNISFRVGEEFADAQLLDKREVLLEPNGNTLVQQNWTAVGGDTVLWVAIGDSILASFPLSVNWLPVLTYIPDQRLMQDQPFLLRLAAKDKGGEPLNWSEDCPLFKFSKTNSTGAEISFRPTNDDVGVYPVNFSMTDPHGCSARQLVRFTVENVNDPPWLEYIPNLAATEEARFSYRVNATDPDIRWGDKLAFSDDSILFDIDPTNGNFSFTPTNAQVGKYFIEIAVSDNQSVTNRRTFNLTVQNTNDPPSIEAIPPQTATQGKLWQVMARSSDPDQATPQGDRLRFSDDSPLFDINPESGLVTFTPANKDVGLRTCNITVTDMAGASCSTKLQLTVLNVNDPPLLSAIPDQTATEEVPFEMAVTASDPDVPLKLDNLTFSDDSPLFDIDQKTGRMAFTPSNAQVGRHTIRITVKDESGETAGRTFLLTVQNVNDPPFNVSITSLLPGARFRESDTVWLNATGADEDAGDRLVFVWLDNDIEVGRGRSVQVKLKSGDHLIKLKVSDGNATVTSEVSVRVAKTVKEQVTVQNDWWILLVVITLAAAAAGGAFLAMKRSRRKEPEGRPPEAGVAAAGVAAAPSPKKKLKKAAAGAGVAATAVAATPPPAPPVDSAQRDRARNALNSAEDAIADALESGADTTAAMDSLDIAKDFFKSGDFSEAATYAKEAEDSIRGAGGKAGGDKAGPGVGKLACPGCGEELSPEWGACPICGHKTR